MSNWIRRVFGYGAAALAVPFAFYHSVAHADVPAPTAEGIEEGLGDNTDGSETGIYLFQALQVDVLTVVLTVALIGIGFGWILRKIRMVAGRT